MKKISLIAAASVVLTATLFAQEPQSPLFKRLLQL